MLHDDLVWRKALKLHLRFDLCLCLYKNMSSAIADKHTSTSLLRTLSKNQTKIAWWNHHEIGSEMLCGNAISTHDNSQCGCGWWCFHHTIWFVFLITDFQDISERSWGVLVGMFHHHLFGHYSVSVFVHVLEKFLNDALLIFVTFL